MLLPDLFRPPELPSDAGSAARAMLRTLVVMERSGVFLLAVGFFGIIIMATEARDRVRQAANNSAFAQPSAALNTTHAVTRLPDGRYVYPYSVIPGGVQSADELQTAVYTDPVVGQHYFDFDVSQAKFFTIDRDVYYFVSYRVKSGVFWTKAKVKVHRGERLVTDGATVARTRCGNRLSVVPQLPISSGQPTLAELELPNELVPPPAAFTPAIARLVHSPPTPFIFVPPIFFPPGGSPGTPIVPPIFFAANPPAGLIVFLFSILSWLIIRWLLRRSSARSV